MTRPFMSLRSTETGTRCCFNLCSVEAETAATKANDSEKGEPASAANQEVSKGVVVLYVGFRIASLGLEIEGVGLGIRSLEIRNRQKDEVYTVPKPMLSTCGIKLKQVLEANY